MKHIRHALPSLAVAGLGALVLHQLVYLLLAGAGGLNLTGDHGHLSTQWALITPAAVIGAASLVLRQIRSLGYSPTSTLRLSVSVSLLFICQESIEATLAGNSAASFLLSPAAVVGIALAPVVGAAMAAGLRTVADVVALFVETTNFVKPVAGNQHGTAPLAANTSIVVRFSPSRGPPFSFV